MAIILRLDFNSGSWIGEKYEKTICGFVVLKEWVVCVSCALQLGEKMDTITTC